MLCGESGGELCCSVRVTALKTMRNDARSSNVVIRIAGRGH